LNTKIPIYGEGISLSNQKNYLIVCGTYFVKDVMNRKLSDLKPEIAMLRISQKKVCYFE